MRSAIALGIVALDERGYLANGADDLGLLLEAGFALAAVDLVIENVAGACYRRTLAVAEALVAELRHDSTILGFEPDRYGGVLTCVLPPYHDRVAAIRRVYAAVRATDIAVRRA